MKAISVALCSLLCVLAAVPVMFLGLIENALLGGFVTSMGLLVIAGFLFRRAENLMTTETIGNRMYRGSLQ